MERNKGTDSLREFLAQRPDWIVCDYSQVQLWEQCGQKYKHTYIDKLSQGPKVAAEFSSLLIHDPLSRWYLEAGNWIPHSRYWAGQWTTFAARTQHAALSKREEAAYQLHVAQQIISEYTHAHAIDFSMYRVVDSEVIYWVAWDDLKVVWLSKPDLLLEHIADGSRMSGDFKSSIYNFNESLIAYDRQFLSQVYTTGSQHMMKAFVQIHLDKKMQFSHIEWSPRNIQQVNPDLLEGWARDMRQNVAHLRLDIDRGVFPKRAPKACFDYNRTCPFKRFCDLGSAAEYVLQYEPRTNPLEYLGL